MRCKDCKHWGPRGDDQLRPCGLIYEVGDENDVRSESYPPVGIFVADNVGPRAELWTRPEFGCQLFVTKAE